LFHNETLKEELLEAARKQFADEVILFYIAIREWEKNSSTGKKREAGAKAIVDKFVRPGSERENGCLSSTTKSELLEAETIEEHHFHFAKQEALNDIYMNTYLRAILQPKDEKDDNSSS